MAKAMPKTEQDYSCEVCSSGPSPCAVKDAINAQNGILFVYKNPAIHTYKPGIGSYFEYKWTKNVIDTLRNDHHIDHLMKNGDINSKRSYDRLFSHMYLRRCLGKKKKPSAKELDECIWTFWKRLEIVKPKVLVFLSCDIVKRLNTFYNNYKGYKGKKKNDPDKRKTKFTVTESNNDFVTITNPFNGKEYKGFIAQSWDAAVSNQPGWEKHYWKILSTTKLAVEYYAAHPKFNYMKDDSYKDKFVKRVLVLPKSMKELEAVAKEIISFNKLPKGDRFTRPIIAADTETNTLFPYARGARIIAFSFGWGFGKEMKATAFPFLHKDAKKMIPDFDIARVSELTKQIFESQKGFVFHNAKFDLKFIEHKYGWNIDNLEWDTMIGEYLLYEAMGDNGLKAITKREMPMFAGYENMLKDAQSKVNVSKLDSPEEDSEEDSDVTTSFTPNYQPDLPQWFNDCPEGVIDKDRNDRIHIEEFREKNDLMSYENFKIEDMLHYAAIDAFITNFIFYGQIKKMSTEMLWTNKLCEESKQFIANSDEHFDPFNLLKEVLLPSTETLSDMEYHGMPLDFAYTENLRDELISRIDDLETQIRAYPEFAQYPDFTKTTVLDKVLFNSVEDGGFGIKPVAEKNKLGYNAINDEFWDFYIDKVKEDGAVVDWTSEHLVLELLYKHKKARKVLATYISNWLKLSIFDGGIHASYSIIGTSSGRLSSFSPNMQNLPAFILNLNIKKCFVAPPGCFLNDADYSAAEIRIATWYSNASAYILSFNNERDFHCNTAAILMEDMPQYAHLTTLEERYAEALAHSEEKTHELFALRQDCKRIIFGLLYGKGAYSFAKDFGISESEAQEFMNKFLDIAPEVRDNYINPKQAFFEKYGFITTYYGFKRRMPWGTISFGKKMAGKRKAINIPIQGTSSNNVLMSLNAKNAELKKLGGRLLCTVHDSIVDCAPHENVFYYESLTKEAMQDLHVELSEKIHHKMPIEFAYESAYGFAYGSAKLKFEDIQAKFGTKLRKLNKREVTQFKKML